MTDQSPQTLSPQEARALIEQGATLIDVREASERSTVIPGAQHAPLSKIEESALPTSEGAVIFHCRSGRRTAMNASVLQQKAEQCRVYLLDGGIDGWAAEGLPTQPVTEHQ